MPVFAQEPLKSFVLTAVGKQNCDRLGGSGEIPRFVRDMEGSAISEVAKNVILILIHSRSRPGVRACGICTRTVRILVNLSVWRSFFSSGVSP